jgi:membrane-associated phospholipid phosphatase
MSNTTATPLRNAATVISVVFNPLLLPAATFPSLLAFADRPVGVRLASIAVAVAFSTVIPAAFVLFLMKRGRVESADIEIKEQRMTPFAVGVASYALGAAALFALQSSPIAEALMVCYATNTVATLVITRWWKISAHAIGISGPLVALHYQFGSPLIPFYALIPLVAGSRVILRKHTTGQVVAGAVLGLGLTAAQLAWLLS